MCIILQNSPVICGCNRGIHILLEQMYSSTRFTKWKVVGTSREMYSSTPLYQMVSGGHCIVKHAHLLSESIIQRPEVGTVS